MANYLKEALYGITYKRFPIIVGYSFD